MLTWFVIFAIVCDYNLCWHITLQIFLARSHKALTDAHRMCPRQSPSRRFSFQSPKATRRESRIQCCLHAGNAFSRIAGAAGSGSIPLKLVFLGRPAKIVIITSMITITSIIIIIIIITIIPQRGTARR